MSRNNDYAIKEEDQKDLAYFEESQKNMKNMGGEMTTIQPFAPSLLAQTFHRHSMI